MVRKNSFMPWRLVSNSYLVTRRGWRSATKGFINRCLIRWRLQSLLLEFVKVTGRQRPLPANKMIPTFHYATNHGELTLTEASTVIQGIPRAVLHLIVAAGLLYSNVAWYNAEKACGRYRWLLSTPILNHWNWINSFPLDGNFEGKCVCGHYFCSSEYGYLMFIDEPDMETRRADQISSHGQCSCSIVALLSLSNFPYWSFPSFSASVNILRF